MSTELEINDLITIKEHNNIPLIEFDKDDIRFYVQCGDMKLMISTRWVFRAEVELHSSVFLDFIV